MTIQLPLTLPAYTPTSWELTLPDYPVIVSGFRSAFYPEILGSLPSDSRWRLVFESMTDDEALALLLPWRATGGGQWPLTALPEALAYGVDDADFRKRLTGTTWTIEREPTKEPVKKGRYNVTIELIYELTFSSLYGPKNPSLAISDIPVLLNLSNVLSVVPFAGAPIFVRPLLPATRNAGPILALDLATIDGLNAVAFPVSLDKTVRRDIASSALNLNLPGDPLTPAWEVASVPPRPPISRSSDAVTDLALESGMTVAGDSPTKTTP